MLRDPTEAGGLTNASLEKIDAFLDFNNDATNADLLIETLVVRGETLTDPVPDATIVQNLHPLSVTIRSISRRSISTREGCSTRTTT